MKKLLAVLLAAVLMLALAVPAFAYVDLDLFEPYDNGRILVKETYVYDDEEEFSDYSEGTWDGCVFSGWEYEYSDYENDMYIYRERLDGVWKDYDEWVYKYDDQGNVVGEVYNLYDANGDKTIECRIDYLERDEDGNVTKLEKWESDGEGSFYKYYEKEKTYTDGKLTCQKWTYYNPDGSFSELYIETYSYDEDGNRKSYEYFCYLEEGSQDPDYAGKYEYEYNEDGNITESVYYPLGENPKKTTYEYDSKGRVKEIHYYDYDGQEAQEIKWLKTGMHYEISYEETADGYIAITECYASMAAKAELEEEELSEETSIEAKNDRVGVDLVGKDIITLDKYGDIVKDQMFNWNNETEEWEAYMTATYVYEENEEPERKSSENPIIIDGKYDDETTGEVNPNTGAPVMSVALATVVCGAALIICKKHK